MIPTRTGRIRSQRDQQVEAGSPAERRRENADDDVRVAVEEERPPENGRIGGEASPPESVAQDHNPRPAAGPIFVRAEVPPEHRRCAESRQEVGCYRRATGDLGASSRHHREAGADAGDGRE
jgi:hypothetical protein